MSKTSSQALRQRFSRLTANRTANRSLCFGLLFALFWLVSWKKLDLDFGWHLMAGNYFRAHGIPQHDIFSYTASNFPWIDHEWGSDVITSILYGLGGYGLLAVFYSLLWSAAVLIVGWRARFATLMIAAVALFPYVGVRQIAWTVLFMAVVLRIMQSQRTRLKWALPLLFIPWANLHGGFIVGLAVIAFFALRERKRYLVYILLLSVLATFVNAYGPSVYIEIARTLFDPSVHSQINEWASLTIKDPSRPFVVLWVVGLLLFVGWRPQRWFRLSSLMFLAALSATRNLPLFVIAAVQELDGFLLQARQAIPKRLDVPRKLVLAVIVTGLAVALAQAGYSMLWPLTNREANYPVQATAYLKAHGCQGGHLFNAYDYGGYLIWKLPEQPVYIDGRMAPWRDPNGQKYLTSYIKLVRGQAPYQAEFRRYNIRCALLGVDSRHQKIVGELTKDHWKIILQTRSSVLLQAPAR